jgi:hypothetical protein
MAQAGGGLGLATDRLMRSINQALRIDGTHNHPFIRVDLFWCGARRYRRWPCHAGLAGEVEDSGGIRGR